MTHPTKVGPPPNPVFQELRPKMRIRLQDTMSSEADTSADFSSINITPERVFKVIFVGDSCVGKSSLIRRISRSGWSQGPGASITSTIGVDFQTRSLIVDQTSICIQCWDTAGQERYRWVQVDTG